MKRIFLFALIYGLSTSCSLFQSNLEPFGITYSKLTPEQTRGYKLLIVNPNHYSRNEIKHLKTNGLKLIAHFDPLKISDNDWFCSSLKSYFLDEPNTDARIHYCNFNNPKAKNLLLDMVIADMLSKGFDGFYFASLNEYSEGSSHYYLRNDFLEFIGEIRQLHPQTLLFQEEGLSLLNESRHYINGVIIDDVASSYNDRLKESRFKDEKSFKRRTQKINLLAEKYELPFYIVDYAYSRLLKKKIRARLESIDYPFFITTSEFEGLPVRSY